MAQRCWHCFREKESGEEVCAECGFSNAGYAPKNWQLQPGSILDGRYIAGRVLGSGGFGVTYSVFDWKNKERAAAKELFVRNISGRDGLGGVHSKEGKEELFSEIKENFLSESRKLMQLKPQLGDGTAEIKDCFEDHGTAYAVMEFIDGPTLKERAAGGLSLEETVKLLSPVAAALEKIHGCGMLHLDVSPDNIIVPKNGTAKLVDFGGAKAAGLEGGRAAVSCKKGYTPPEQRGSRGRVDARADVYGLAATVYFCLTGKAPADCEERQAGEEIIFPAELKKHVPESAERALAKALSLNPEERYGAISEFWSALRAGGNKKKRVPPGILAAAAVIAAAAIGSVVYFNPLGLNFNSAGKAGEEVSGSSEKSESAPSDAKASDENEKPGSGAKQDGEVLAAIKVGDTVALDPGTYIFENAADRNLIMGIDSGFGDAGARLILKEYEDRNCNRIFVTAEEDGDGFYNLKAAHTNCLIEAASQELGSGLVQYTESFGQGTERWAFVYCGHDEEKDMDAVIIRNSAGTVMSPSGGKAGAGAEIVLAKEDENDKSQVWYVRWSEKDDEPDAPVRSEGELVEGIEGNFNLVSALDGKMSAAVSGDKEYHEQPTLVVYAAEWLTKDDRQFIFKIEPTGSESRYRIYSEYEGDVLRCLEYDPEDDELIVNAESKSKYQLFRIIYAGYNTYLLQTYDETLLCIEADGDKAADGTVVRAKKYEDAGDSRLVKWMLKKEEDGK